MSDLLNKTVDRHIPRPDMNAVARLFDEARGCASARDAAFKHKEAVNLICAHYGKHIESLHRRLDELEFYRDSVMDGIRTIKSLQVDALIELKKINNEEEKHVGK